jgi:hypothetical protein
LQPERLGVRNNHIPGFGECTFSEMEYQRAGADDAAAGSNSCFLAILVRHRTSKITSVGANLDNGDPGTPLFSITRFFKFLPEDKRHAFLGRLSKSLVGMWPWPSSPAIGFSLIRVMSNLEVHYQQLRSPCGDDLEGNLIALGLGSHREARASSLDIQL